MRKEARVSRAASSHVNHHLAHTQNNVRIGMIQQLISNFIVYIEK
jgi:hypothetical protein